MSRRAKPIRRAASGRRARRPSGGGSWCASTGGYTIVEVIMALSVLAIGGMGIVALQKFTVFGGYNARAVSGATAVAAGWIDVVQDEAAAWNVRNNSEVTSVNGTMPILTNALQANGAWIAIPTGWDAPLGNRTPLAGSQTDNFYCSWVRAAWLGTPTIAPPATVGANGNGPTDVVRVDVRTMYVKSGRTLSTTECGWTGLQIDTMLAGGSGALAPDGLNSRFAYGFVYASGTVRRNTFR